MPPQFPANGQGHGLLIGAEHRPLRLGFGLVAPNPIEQIGSSAGSPVAFAQPGGDLVGNGGRIAAAAIARDIAAGAGCSVWADRQGDAVGEGGGDRGCWLRGCGYRPRRCHLRRWHVTPGAKLVAVLPGPVGVLADV